MGLEALRCTAVRGEEIWFSAHKDPQVPFDGALMVLNFVYFSVD